MTLMSSILDLEELDQRIFRGTTPSARSSVRVFGGQVAAQALIAAGRTVPADRPVHSLHSYFLRPGDPSRPIIYEVDAIRDGGSYTTRRVVAIQHGEAIFHLSASFQRPQLASVQHQVPQLDAPDPDSLPAAAEVMDRLDGRTAKWLTLIQAWHPIEMRFVDEPARAKVARGEKPPPVEQVWLRLTEPIGDDPLLHACVATFSSDMLLLGSALPPHGLAYGDAGLMAVSLDHAVWFHRRFRADEWYLHSMQSPWADGGRALCHGKMFDRSGVLLADVVQEGLISHRR